jgi:hypothetical protein
MFIALVNGDGTIDFYDSDNNAILCVDNMCDIVVDDTDVPNIESYKIRIGSTVKLVLTGTLEHLVGLDVLKSDSTDLKTFT